MFEIQQLSRTKVKRKKLIVETAYKMFLERGISLTSMNDIAENCNITRRTIYNYFESKTELLNFLMIKIMEEINPDFHLEYDESLNALENMRKLLHTNFESYHNHITDFLFITQVRIYLSYKLNKRIGKDEKSLEMHQAFINEIENVITNGYADGTIRKQEMETSEVAKLVYQSMYGYLSNITIGMKNEKEKYDRKCKNFETMIIEFLENK